MIHDPRDDNHLGRLRAALEAAERKAADREELLRRRAEQIESLEDQNRYLSEQVARGRPWAE
jgi:uncharacterized protein (DUF3084 family)